MTLEEAAANIGRGVVYQPHHVDAEEGVITGYSARYVFVRYGADRHSKATDPGQLVLS